MLAEAKRECDRIIQDAREQAMREASQTEIVKLAEKQADDIVDDAKRQARETRLEMEDWADSILSTLELNLDKFLDGGEARPRAAARALAGDGRRGHRPRADRGRRAGRVRPLRRGAGSRWRPPGSAASSRHTSIADSTNASAAALRCRSRVPDEPDDARRDPPVEVDHLDARVVLVDGEPRRDRHARRRRPRGPGRCRCCRSGTRCSARGPVDASCDSTWSIALQWLKPMMGWRTISFSVGGRFAAASGEPAGTTSTYGSWRSSTVSYGPPTTGSVQKVRSRSPRSIISSSSLSSGDSRSTTSTCGWLSENRRRRRGMIFAPTLWNVPTRRRPASPASSAAHVRLRGEEPRLDRVRVPEEDLAGLGERDRARAARPLDQAQPDDPLERRDLLRDRRLRVAEPLGGAPEGALVGDRLQRDEMAEVEPEPAISFHDRTVASEQES